MSNPNTQSATFRVAALHCADEFALIEKGLGKLAGICRVAPNYVSRSLLVEFEPAQLDAHRIARHLDRIGFPAEEVASTTDATAPSGAKLRATTLAGGLLLAAAAIMHFAWPHARLEASLAILSTLLSGWPVALAGLRAARLRQLDMNSLMTIAAVGAIAIGQWYESATAMFLFGVSLWLEAFSVRRANRAVQTLVGLIPAVAHRLASAGATEVEDIAIDEIAVGDVLLVKPGERIAVDGEVVRGQSSVNQAPITGESLPIEKQPGEKVYAGSLNEEGSLEIQADKAARESTLAHIARLVEEAQASRSPTQRFVDRFAKWYTPAVIAAAVIIAFVPPLLAALGVGWVSDASFSEWFQRGLVLLVIACPCALVISTPVTIVCALHRAARNGMLVKGGEFLESLARVDCVVFDKTGTLTTAQPTVAKVQTVAESQADRVLQIAASLEASSEHPLATAIVAAATDGELELLPVSEFASLRGFGVKGRIDDRWHYVASPRFFIENKLAAADVAKFDLGQPDAGTVALVGTDERLLGVVHLADEVREDAAEAVGQLRQLRVARIAMLTGDNAMTATQLGHSLGIEHVHAELLPEDKVRAVAKFAEDHDSVAMVGDGVNDAPALAAAKVGIALGSQASDTALETADVVMMAARLKRVPELIRLGRQTRGRLIQNISLALGIKLIVLSLAAVGLVTMWMAVAADVGASLLVIFNGMRLLRE